MANYICDKCKKVFPSVSELNKHLLTHIADTEEELKLERERQEKRQELQQEEPLDNVKRQVMKSLEIASLAAAVRNLAPVQDTFKQFLEFREAEKKIAQDIIDNLPEPEEATAGNQDLNNLLFQLFTQSQQNKNANTKDNTGNKKAN